MVNRIFTILLYHGGRVSGGLEMSIILTALLAATSVFPNIDRHSLDVQAEAEAAQSRAAALARTNRPRVQPAPPVSSIRASLRARDLATLVTICGAAANLRAPDEFLTVLGKAYAMPPQEIAALRATCAIYAAGRAQSGMATFTRASW